MLKHLAPYLETSVAIKSGVWHTVATVIQSDTKDIIRHKIYNY